MRLTRAQLKARIAELEAQVADLTGQVTILTSDLADARAVNAGLADEVTRNVDQIAGLNARIADLEQQLQDCQTPTSDPTATLFGVTVTGGVRKTMPDLHDDVAVSRVFSAGATVWANEPQHKAFPNGKWAVSNSYALSESALPKYLDSIPDTDIAKIVGYADGHELEHPDKNLRPADVKARVKRTAPIIRSFGLTVVWCMMGYSLRNDDWLNWVDPDDVDLIALDKYNSANKQNPPAYQDVDSMVAKAVEASQQFGKPWAFWETGTNNFGDQAPRVQWVTDLKAKIIATGGKHAIWFDRPSTSGSTWDATLDRPTAEAWLL